MIPVNFAKKRNTDCIPNRVRIVAGEAGVSENCHLCKLSVLSRASLYKVKVALHTATIATRLWPSLG